MSFGQRSVRSGVVCMVAATGVYVCVSLPVYHTYEYYIFIYVVVVLVLVVVVIYVCMYTVTRKDFTSGKVSFF